MEKFNSQNTFNSYCRFSKSLDDRVRIKVIGIRPGEKIHESLCSSEESDYLLEFKDHFSLAPQSLINLR